MGIQLSLEDIKLVEDGDFYAEFPLWRGSGLSDCLASGVQFFESEQLQWVALNRDLDKELMSKRSFLRDVLGGRDIIQRVTWSEADSGGIMRVGAVDASVREIDFAFDKYLIGTGFWCLGKPTLNVIGGLFVSSFESAAIVQDDLGRLMRLYLEASLGQKVKDTVKVSECYGILDQSWAVLCLGHLKRLRLIYETLNGKGIVSCWIKKLLSGDGLILSLLRNPGFIAMPKSAGSRSLLRKLRLEGVIDSSFISLQNAKDRQVLGYILEPGEYIKPQVLSLAEQGRLYQRWSRGSTRTELNEGLREIESYFYDFSEDRGSCFYYTYFRYGMRIYRIEMHADLALNSEWLNDCLYAVAGAIINDGSTVKEPFSQYYADAVAKYAVNFYGDWFVAQGMRLGQIGAISRVGDGYRTGGVSVWAV